MLRHKNLFQNILLLLCFSCISNLSFSQQLAPLPDIDEKWNQPSEPFRIAGNLYYVGTYDLASYLITTPEGHILINTGLAESLPMIRSSVEKLGFKFSDIKILLANHAHYDHVAAIAEIKKLTGAQFMIHGGEVNKMADGGNSDYLMGGKGPLFEPVETDRELSDHDTVKLGGMSIAPLHHPGHTSGACSFIFNVKDSNRSYTVLIANMPSVIVEGKFSELTGYTDIVSDYKYTFKVMKELKFDIWLAAHASQFGLHEKRKEGDGYNPTMFIDKKGFDKALAGLEKTYLKKLAEDQ